MWYPDIVLDVSLVVAAPESGRKPVVLLGSAFRLRPARKASSPVDVGYSVVWTVDLDVRSFVSLITTYSEGSAQLLKKLTCLWSPFYTKFISCHQVITMQYSSIVAFLAVSVNLIAAAPILANVEAREAQPGYSSYAPYTTYGNYGNAPPPPPPPPPPKPASYAPYATYGTYKRDANAEPAVEEKREAATEAEANPVEEKRQTSYGSYGDYAGVKPAPPPAGYGSYPAPAGGYGKYASYGTYTKE